MVAVNGNAAIHFVDRHRKTVTANKPAFIEGVEGGRTLTYGELADQSDKMADLYARFGLRAEDRAILLVHDTIEFPVIFWGSLKAGVVPVPLNTLLATEVYGTIFNDSRARALFVTASLLPVVESLLADNPHLQAVFVIDGDAGTYLSYAEELAASKPLSMTEVSPDDTAFWLYSSGSTGIPKGVCHVHSALKATADTYGDQVLGIQPDDVIFSAAKFFFAYGLGNAMTFPMSVGATTILLPGRPTPDAVFEVMERTRPTIFCGVPTLYAAMLATLDNQKSAGAAKIRCCISAGEALPAEIGNQWKEIFQVDILDGVGSTELLHIFLSNAPGDVVYGTSGNAVPGYQIRLVDDEGNDVKQGEIGELLVNGPSAAQCYWNQRDKSRAMFEGVWTRTGDKYEQREDGRMIYCGRTDDMFKVSGIWLSPFEVEQALITHPSVLEAAIVAARDDKGLEKPKAYVVLQQGAAQDGLAQALKDHVKDKVGKWKYPRWIEVVETLPKTATGKIQRYKLRE